MEGRGGMGDRSNVTGVGGVDYWFMPEWRAFFIFYFLLLSMCLGWACMAV